jgi:hypothetical protein
MDKQEFGVFTLILHFFFSCHSSSISSEAKPKGRFDIKTLNTLRESLQHLQDYLPGG